MTDISTYKKELYEVYELYHDERTDIAVSGGMTAFQVTGKLAHDDVLTAVYSVLRTRVYINGVRATVTDVVHNINGTDTDIEVAETIVVGDEVDIFLACTTGTLENNQSLGKIPLIELQIAQGFGVRSNKFEQLGCGTERIENITFKGTGRGSLAVARRGNDNLKNFISARKNKKYLMIIVKDTSNVTTYDILHEVRIGKYRRGTQAKNSQEGVVIDIIEFRFVPGVAVTT